MKYLCPGLGSEDCVRDCPHSVPHTNLPSCEDACGFVDGVKKCAIVPDTAVITELAELKVRFAELERKHASLTIRFKDVHDLINLAPGEAVTDVNGVTWKRMQDSSPCHVENFFFNTETGAWKHASFIVMDWA